MQHSPSIVIQFLRQVFTILLSRQKVTNFQDQAFVT